MSYSAMRRKRFTAGVLAGAMALTVMPIIGFTGTASAADPKPPVATPTGDGNVCEDAPETEPFTDVSDTDPGAAEIKCLVNTTPALTQGVTATTYEPNSSITRRQMVLFLKRLADLAKAAQASGQTVNALPAGDGTTTYTDLTSESDAVKTAVDQLDEAGIAKGLSATEFGPGQKVSRRQMAAFVVRLIEYLTGTAPTATDGKDYFDDDNGDSGESNLNIVAELGIFQGGADGNVNPGGDLTRRQMAFVLLRELQVHFKNGTIARLFAEDDGPVALKSTSTTQGGKLEGTVENPGTVQSLSASGCGLSNSNIAVDGAGAFSLTVPASQAPGTCTLAFVIQRTDGTSESQQVPVTITAASGVGTDAPDLVSASIVPGNVVNFLFDEAPNGATPLPVNFHIYSAAGVQSNPSTVTVSGNSVLAQFTAAQMAGITLATVERGAVQDAGGLLNPINGVGLTQATQPAGVTTAPDLVSVGNFGTNGTGNLTADFTFDQPVAPGTQGVAPTGGAAAGDYELILNDNTQNLNITGGANTPVIQNAAGTVVRVTFAAAVTIPQSQIARGVVNAGKVTSNNAAAVPNVMQTADVLFSGNTVPAPDVVSAAVTGTNTVTYTFDQAVDVAIAAAANFRVYNASAVQSAAPTSVTRSNTDSTKVDAVFAPGTVGAAVGAHVLAGGAKASSGPATNQDDEVPLQDVSTQSGSTSLPDLVSVSIVKNALGDAVVTYTFDSALPGAYAAPAADYQLYDDKAFAFTPAGAGVINAARTTVTFVTPPSAPANGFTNSQAAAAVRAGVNDSANAVSVNMTEGGAPASLAS